MSEVRLINANAAISVFAEMGQDIDTHDVIDLLKEQPTVDAVPVRHGHWEIVPNDENTDGYYKMRCSVCGETLWSIQSEELYCCKCGAKMDGADGERINE